MSDIYDWEDEGKPVLGHLCDELRRLQEIGGGCEPDIRADGTIRGCHATNPIPIKFCPMCGADLRQKPLELD